MKLVIAAVAAVVVLIVGVLWWTIGRGPAAEAGAVKTQVTGQLMKQDHSGPSQDQRKQIEDWKRQHPGAYTKY